MALRLILREKYLEKIRPFYDTDNVKVLAGIGRCGKSLLLRSIAEELRARGIPTENILLIDFSRPESASFAYAEGLHQKILTFARESRGKLSFFFDAFDRVDDGEKALALIRADVDCDIYLSVSERAVSVEPSLIFSVYPFGFEEYLACYRENVSTDALDAIFRAFLRTGGMPYVFSLGLDPERVRLYLSDTIKILFVAEIAKRYAIRNIDLLERVAHYVIAHAGTAFSAHDVVRSVKVLRQTTSVDTVINYLRYFCEAGLCFRVPKEKAQDAVGFSSTDTYFLADHGFLRAIASADVDEDAVLRNIVFTEAIRRGFDVKIGRHVDFLCVKDGRKIGISVSKRGLRQKASNRYPIYVLSEEVSESGEEGILARRIVDFLRQDEW